MNSLIRKSKHEASLAPDSLCLIELFGFAMHRLPNPIIEVASLLSRTS